MAVLNSRLLFLLSLVLVFGTTSATYLQFSEETVKTDSTEEGNSLSSDSDDDTICPPNSHYTKCVGLCPRTCANFNDNPAACDANCFPGCVCNRGYVKGPHGRCIKPEECPRNTKKCPLGQHFDTCHYNCQRNCSTMNDQLLICNPMCVPGCVCDEGTVRQSSPHGRCIKPEECPTKSLSDSGTNFCPKNEEYSACEAVCEPTCDHKDAPEGCIKFCTSGCKCKTGFVRNPDGICVKPEECDPDQHMHHPVKKVCPETEEWDYCRGICQKNCTTLEHPVICPRICVPGCVCPLSLIRGKDGKCIRSYQCSEGAGETENEMSLGNEIAEHVDEGEEQTEGSIQESFCPLNEVYSECEAHCERNCKNYKEENLPCIRLCVPGCVCRSGYVRGPRGICIPTSLCPFKILPRPIPKVCTRNEIWSRDSAHCQKNCKTFTDILPCLAISIPGCVCRAGWIRGPDGKCIMPKECPQGSENLDEDALFPFLPKPTLPPIICDRNEVLTLCYKTCQDDCSNYKDKHRRCPTICIPSCVCASGYVRGPDGKCIKPDQCPKEKKPEDCTELEYYDTCGTACEDNCTNYNLPERVCDKRCVVGCFCLRGYIRGPKGDCIWPFNCVKSTLASEDASSEQWASADLSENMDPPQNGRNEMILDEEESNTSICVSESECRDRCLLMMGRDGYCVDTDPRTCICG